MKRKIISIILLILPIIILFISVSLMVMGDPIIEHGVPPYVLETYKEIEGTVTHITHVKFRADNILLMFAILSIPIFLSGYLWAKSKNTISEPSNTDIKKLSIIISVLVGLLLTLGFQEIIKRSKSSYAEAKSQRIIDEWRTVSDHSTENFLIMEGYRPPKATVKEITSFGKASRRTEYILRIEPRVRNGISVELGMAEKKIHSMILKDKSETLLWIIDDDLDGLYDDAMYSSEGIDCDYARSSIFPMMFRTPTGKVARINGKYYELDSFGHHHPVIKYNDKWTGVEWVSGEGYISEYIISEPPTPVE